MIFSSWSVAGKARMAAIIMRFHGRISKWCLYDKGEGYKAKGVRYKGKVKGERLKVKG